MPLTTHLPADAAALAERIHAALANPDPTGQLVGLYDITWGRRRVLSPAACDLLRNLGQAVSNAERTVALFNNGDSTFRGLLAEEARKTASARTRDLEVVVEALAYTGMCGVQVGA